MREYAESSATRSDIDEEQSTVYI